MNRMLVVVALALTTATGSTQAQTYVQGYTRADGTYVQGHYRSAPNNSRLDNYSTRGNVNPYTGAAGTVDPYPTPYQSSYSAPVYQPQQPVYTVPAPNRYNAPATSNDVDSCTFGCRRRSSYDSGNW